MDAEALANTLAEQVNSMQRGQYLLLASALRALGGSMTITAGDLAAAAVAQLPELDISIEGEVIKLELHDATRSC